MSETPLFTYFEELLLTYIRDNKEISNEFYVNSALNFLEKHGLIMVDPADNKTKLTLLGKRILEQKE